MAEKKEKKTDDPEMGNASEQKSAEDDQTVEQETVELPEETALAVKTEEIDAVIRNRVYAALALGLAPIPVVDLVGLTAIQIDLVRVLAKKYNVPFKKNAAKTIITALVGSVLPVGAAPLFASMMKLVPFVGLTTGAVSMSILGGASTYAIGKVFNRHFASGGTLLDVDTAKVKDSFQEQYEKGKSYASSLKKKKGPDKEAPPTESEKEANSAEPKTA
jgi:uncharacterized protein (DUF697 family)